MGYTRTTSELSVWLVEWMGRLSGHLTDCWTSRSLTLLSVCCFRLAACDDGGAGVVAVGRTCHRRHGRGATAAGGGQGAQPSLAQKPVSRTVW